jgi:predicted nucleic acid-binding protein
LPGVGLPGGIAISAHDATYVAVADVLGWSLVTGEERLAGAPGPTCSIVVVRG